MSIEAYLESVKERLLTDEIVVNFQILRERATLVDGYLRVRLKLFDSSLLESSEYVQLSSSGEVQVVTYSYHWADAQNNLIHRWDNTPHHPGLAGFPHHIHESTTGSIVPGTPVDIFCILDKIARHTARSAPS